MNRRPEGESCYTCRFLDDAGYNGYCHRRAPVIAPDGKERFPHVSHGEWCGEWESAETTETP